MPARLRLALSAGLAAGLFSGVASAADNYGGWSQPRAARPAAAQPASARPTAARPTAAPVARSGHLKWRASAAVRPAPAEREIDQEQTPTVQAPSDEPKQIARGPAFRRTRSLTEPARLSRVRVASPLPDDFQQPGDVILAKAPGEPNPLTDPFEEGDAPAARPSQLKLFATGIEGDARVQADEPPLPDFEDDVAPSRAIRGQRAAQRDDGTRFSDEGPIAQGPEVGLERCPTPADLKHISKITDDIAADPVGGFPPECPLSTDPFPVRNFMQTTYTWKASALCHKPLYFEAVPLERYGHSWGPILQPFVSGAHFFVSVPLLPYKMGLEPPWECIYALGYYRPGSCAPYTLGPIPISLRGAALQGAAVTGAVFAFP